MCNIHCTAIVIINIFGKIITGLRTSFKKCSKYAKKPIWDTKHVLAHRLKSGQRGKSVSIKFLTV